MCSRELQSLILPKIGKSCVNFSKNTVFCKAHFQDYIEKNYFRGELSFFWSLHRVINGAQENILMCSFQRLFVDLPKKANFN